MMENIRFSVIIPVYNVEKYLAECVSSVLNQTFENFEIILVDDGSPDGSAAICDSFTDNRVRVFHNKNHGVLYSRHFAVMQAKGEYSVFIDSDDYVDYDFLENINRIIEEERCDIVSFSYKRINSKQVDITECLWTEKTVFEGETLTDFEEKLIFNPQLNSLCIKAIKTSLLKADKTDFDNIKAVTGEDLLASLYPVFTAEKIVYVPEHWYNYRQNESSVTHTVNPDRYKSIVTVRKYAYDFFEKSNFYNEENVAKFSSNFVKSMMDCVASTASANFNFSVKEKTFNGIINDSFYNKMIKSLRTSMLPKKQRIIYELFNKKQYRTIVTICRLMSK